MNRNCIVGAGRSPHRQMRRYLPCGEGIVMSISHSGEDKNEMFPHYSLITYKTVFTV